MATLQFDSKISNKDSESSKKAFEEAAPDNEQDKVRPLLLEEVLPPHQVHQEFAGMQINQAETAHTCECYPRAV